MTLSCFDLGEQMLSVEEARHALATLIERPLGSENIPLARAHGRRLAGTIQAPINVPQNTNAAMDGVALALPREGVGAKQTHWPLAGEVLAGQYRRELVPAGHCVRITTGAPLPPGTDTVVMSEQLREPLDEQPEHVIIESPERLKHGQHVRQAGEDIAIGDTALPEGARLDAASLGLLASLGYAEITVCRRPKVAIFSTGNEVTAPGDPLPKAGIYDANRFTLIGLLTEQGADVIDLGILPDDLAATTEALEQAAAQSDLVITSGGVSVGQADFTRAALEQLGRLAFWRVALRPGRPMACGWLGAKRTPFVGLPGNPVAVMVTFLQFVAPLLDQLCGQPTRPPHCLNAIADDVIKSRLRRTDFIRGIYHTDEQGQLHVRSTGAQGSGILTSMVAANCLIELADDQDGAQPGEVVSIQPLTGWL
ncbi:MAG: molybdopterin molybdenumtransferase MoeA [Gammaproteobacteria bacterium]|uniref:Molybdopterin molybdenumtransferase n=1 Tax=Vreelandella titanicae TaxID=664683 RepID=A0A558JDP7_9GAMM|nr:gephyrin-like molybdotransferase Glp [Halomonas titanicae]MBR9904046.1 molybdopterin molybdenumtransferase MoeA [Gammaproteobacteria bacterium]TVU91758.1 molybdopterin molybdenumtransferase MoeA [Halomonas titanicae]